MGRNRGIAVDAARVKALVYKFELKEAQARLKERYYREFPVNVEEHREKRQQAKALCQLVRDLHNPDDGGEASFFDRSYKGGKIQYDSLAIVAEVLGKPVSFLSLDGVDYVEEGWQELLEATRDEFLLEWECDPPDACNRRQRADQIQVRDGSAQAPPPLDPQPHGHQAGTPFRLHLLADAARHGRYFILLHVYRRRGEPEQVRVLLPAPNMPENRLKPGPMRRVQSLPGVGEQDWFDTDEHDIGEHHFLLIVTSDPFPVQMDRWAKQVKEPTATELDDLAHQMRAFKAKRGASIKLSKLSVSIVKPDLEAKQA